MAAGCVAAALPSGDAAAQAGRARVDEGNRLYSEGRFDEAYQRYMDALRENPDSPVIRFNAANALYRSQDYQRAMEAYEQAVQSGDPKLQSAAWYNLGNALYRAQQLEPALEAYKQALRTDPTDQDAKHNLERVLEEMQQEQEQEPQEGDQGEQGDPQDQPQDSQSGQDQQPGDENPQEQPQEGDQPQDSEEQPGEGQAQRQPGEMSREEAERLLDALDEDPGDVNRKPASAQGRRPRKPW
jgi:tetratricopeptide (TPR) repeat protein